MKTLKTASAFIMLLTLVFTFASCKKDKKDPDGADSSNYQYAGTKYKITSALEKHIAGDIFLELGSENPGDYLQIAFANVGALPEGALTYHGDRNAGYNPATNFWSGSIGIGGAPVEISGGNINVSKSGDSYTIGFDIDTPNGKISGQFKGTTTVTQ